MLRLWTAYQSRFIQDEEGASMVEYALLVALIAVVVIAAALFLGDQISTNPTTKYFRTMVSSRVDNAIASLTNIPRPRGVVSG